MPSDLQALLARLEAAQGPDRELDAAIWLAFTPGATRRTLHVPHWKRPYDIDETRDATGRLIVVPEVTASLDAAISLVERVLPGRGVEIMTPDRGMWRGQFWRWTNDGQILPGEWTPSYAPTPALAILTTLVKAKIAETPQ